MSAFQDRVAEDLKKAMKDGDERRRDVLRMLRAEFMREEIALMKKDKGLTEEESQKVLSREIRKREETASVFRNVKREDRAQAEEAEAGILRAYLAPQYSDGELREIVQEVIQQTGATSEKEMGAVMKGVMAKVAGKADGARVREVVMEKLSAMQSPI